MNYYNEFDPGAAQWLRNLIAAGKLPAGTVDERDIRLVQPADLKEFVQCHFFAGIGGWSLALALVGWPEDRPVWTGSCPCQPFSVCGNKKGKSDERHLWPVLRKFVAVWKPPVIFGEQVASPLGREWFAGVRADLEVMGYRVGAADLCAASVGAPHRRQRLYWVADARQEGCRFIRPRNDHDGHYASGHDAHGCREADRVGLASSSGLEKRQGEEVEQRAVRDEREAAGARGPWGNYSVVECSDGRARRVGSGVFPLAYGVPARVGKLRAYGNAIIPQVAAEFIKAYLETRTG